MWVCVGIALGALGVVVVKPPNLLLCVAGMTW